MSIEFAKIQIIDENAKVFLPKLLKRLMHQSHRTDRLRRIVHDGAQFFS